MNLSAARFVSGLSLSLVDGAGRDYVSSPRERETHIRAFTLSNPSPSVLFAVRHRRRARPRDAHAALRRLERLAVVLDSAIVIPGTRFRFGADAILGLFPGGGDVVGAALSGYIVVAAARLGVPFPALARMIGNVIVDTAFGAIPLAGDAFDAYWKANLRNIAILREHVARTAGPAPR